MGLETATLTAIATGIGAAGSIITGLANKPKQQAVDPLKPPVESKTPDANVFKDKNAIQGRGGAASTLLAPMGGVPNTSLNLGRNTLLGA